MHIHGSVGFLLYSANLYTYLNDKFLPEDISGQEWNNFIYGEHIDHKRDYRDQGGTCPPLFRTLKNNKNNEKGSKTSEINYIIVNCAK